MSIKTSEIAITLDMLSVYSQLSSTILRLKRVLKYEEESFAPFGPYYDSLRISLEELIKMEDEMSKIIKSIGEIKS